MARKNRWMELEERWEHRLANGALSVESRAILRQCIREMKETREANLLTGLASIMEEADAPPPAPPKEAEGAACPDRREHGRCDHFECIEERLYRASRASGRGTPNG